MEPEDDQPLLVDELSERLARFRILYDRDDAATDELLAELGGQSKVEREMMRELAAVSILRRPDRVPEAHAVAMHAPRVLSRNGTRPPSRLPPARSAHPGRLIPRPAGDPLRHPPPPAPGRRVAAGPVLPPSRLGPAGRPLDGRSCFALGSNAALWETIGWWGRPPRDTASLMAAIAIALTVVGWLLIPLGLFLEFALF